MSFTNKVNNIMFHHLSDDIIMKILTTRSELIRNDNEILRIEREHKLLLEQALYMKPIIEKMMHNLDKMTHHLDNMTNILNKY